jgi:hypothetical protein
MPNEAIITTEGSNVFGKAKNERIKKIIKIRAIIAIRESRAKLAYAMPNEAIIL